MTIKDICTRIDERREELFALLSELIKFDSQSFGSRGLERGVAEHIHAICARLACA